MDLYSLELEDLTLLPSKLAGKMFFIANGILSDKRF